jgi:hypothetical protein
MSTQYEWSVPKRLAFDFDPGGDAPVDPYWIWAELSKYQSFRVDKEQYPIIFEIGDLNGTGVTELDRIFVTLLVNKHTLNRVYPSSFGTALVSGDELNAIVELTRRDVIRRYQLCAGRFKAFDAPLDGGRPDDPGEGSDVVSVAGIIDDGFPIAHGAFRPNSREHKPIIALWDQSSQYGVIANAKHWTKGLILNYGSELLGEELANVTGFRGDALTLERCGEARESDMYRELGRPHWGEPGRTHGTCVMHVISGGDDQKASTNTVLVQLPTSTVADTSGGSLALYVLDGARYIYWKAREFAGSNELRLAINVSFGSIAGPHDGTSIVERALDELCEAPKISNDLFKALAGSSIGNNQIADIDVVLAAGNTGGKRIHGSREIAKHTPPGRFYFMVPPANPRESYLELWIPADVEVDKLIVSVTPPGVKDSVSGALMGEVSEGKTLQLSADGQVVACLVFAKRVCQSDGSVMGTMALLCVAATARPNLSLMPFGVWTIEVRTGSDKPTIIHAWVERNDNVVGARTQQQAYLVEEIESKYLSDNSTLSSIANGAKTTVVGAYELLTGGLSPYSARGPVFGRQSSPNFFLGPADESMLTPGRQYPGFYTGALARMSGTSIAAPHVTRWILDGRPTSNDEQAAKFAVEGGGVRKVLER